MSTKMPGDTAADFYAERDRRTLQYVGGDASYATVPVTIVIATTCAESDSGQIAILALVNMLARVHRRLRVVGPRGIALTVPALVTAQTLDEALIETARAIDPFMDAQVADVVDTSTSGITVGIGTTAETGLDCYLGWHGGQGSIDSAPLTTGGSSDDLLGAASAACLAAAAVFGLARGRPLRKSTVNLAERTEDSDAGSTSVRTPLDCGTTLVVGAGAVGSALLYWARVLGHSDEWHVVDRDPVELHNTSRSIGMTAGDAGWGPHGHKSEPQAKAVVGARLVGGEAHVEWYHEHVAHESVRYATVVPVANEHGIRAAVPARGVAVVLHATTSPDWTAELHRHLNGVDDCPACRIPPQRVARFQCSTVPLSEIGDESTDAALPFLSATAGLMLYVALAQASKDDADLLHGRSNHWRLHLRLEHRLWQAMHHAAGQCPHWPNSSRGDQSGRSYP